MSWLRAWQAAGRCGVAMGLPYLWIRDRGERSERLGNAPDGRGIRPLWVHAASMGEAVAAGALVAAVRTEAPRPVALSATTRTGKERARAARPELGPFHIPIDAPGPVARAVERLAPSAFVTLETELWPTLLDTLARRGVPWGIASGRMSARGFRRKRAVRGLYAGLLARVAAIGARTEEDAARFAALGAPADRLTVTGDLKEDRAVPDFAPPPPGARWIAACTRPGEEDVVLAAVEALSRRIPRGELLLAPRHPERFEEVARHVARTGLACRRWEQRDDEAGPGWSVVLVDRMGVMDEAYRRVQVAFVGGSLVPLGGHSPWEAAAAGRPVITGLSVDTVREAVDALAAAGAARSVPDAAGLADAVGRLLADPPAAEAGGRAAWNTLRARSGAARATVDWFRSKGLLA